MQLQSDKEFANSDFVIGCDGQNSIVGEKIFGKRELSQIICVSGIVEDYQFDKFLCREGYLDYPYETLGTCSLTKFPARFADIPLTDKEEKKQHLWFATVPKPISDFEPDSIKQLILESFCNFHEPIPSIIKQSQIKDLEIIVE